jgi:hypothetical protein
MMITRQKFVAFNTKKRIIAAYSTRFPGGQRLTNAFVVETSRPLPPMFIKPGEIVTGKIELAEVFPSIADDIKKFDIVIFWSFDLSPCDKKLTRTNGSLTLPASHF